ncbi:MAG TPA: glycosyltransferase family 39 protein [Ktedonobacterales bacterium]|nr:glycosyltransferase family 39 protein [Ktedonobacterales bacterium]
MSSLSDTTTPSLATRLRSALTSDLAPAATLALLIFIAHMLMAGNYGYFRDELYYLVAGMRLAPGYVDFPPMIALLAALTHLIVRDNLVAIHIIPALAAAALVFITALMARALGGGRFAQTLAALGSAASVVFLATGSIFSMDILDALWWALGAYVLIQLVRRDDPRLWLAFGLVAGLGLTTKLTMLFFGFAIFTGALLTSRRRDFRTPWPWLGGLIAFVFLLPYLLWNAANGWPTVAFWGHYGGLTGGGPIGFLANQILAVNPLNIPLVIAGLVFYFRGAAGKPWRMLGWSYVILYVLLTLINAKTYFLAPAYPMLFAAGGVRLSEAFTSPRWRWARLAYPTAIAFFAIALAPLAMPILPPATFVADYGWLTGAGNSAAGQGQATMPQYLGDRFGWDTMTADVTRVYDSLPPAERAQACVFTANYGEASALTLLAAPGSLPPIISGHNTYWLWGPGSCSGRVIIAVGIPRSDLAQSYASITSAGVVRCIYCQPEENGAPIYICAGPKLAVPALWPRVRRFN